MYKNAIFLFHSFSVFIMPGLCIYNSDLEENKKYIHRNLPHNIKRNGISSPPSQSPA